jgi:hypothetical protein
VKRSLLLLLLFSSTRAFADDIPSLGINAGFYSRTIFYPNGDSVNPGLGLEVSLHGYPWGQPNVGLGLFGQVEAAGRGDDAHHHLRMTFGGQINVVPWSWKITGIGVEVGGCYESSDMDHAGAMGLHVAPFASLGLITLSLPVVLPISTSGSGTERGFGLGISATFKIPIPLRRAGF